MSQFTGGGTPDGAHLLRPSTGWGEPIELKIVQLNIANGRAKWLTVKNSTV